MKISLVKNRSNRVYEFTFEGIVHKIPAGETLAMPADAAAHGIRKSYVSMGDEGGMNRVLCLADSPDAEEVIEAREAGSELWARDPSEGEVKTIKFANPELSKGRVSSALDG
jgi:hypothetical protein